VALGAFRATALAELPAVVELAGLGAILVGVGMVSLPAAFVLAGVAALLWSYGAKLERKETER
jgi:hypothetical protein